MVNIWLPGSGADRAKEAHLALSEIFYLQQQDAPEQNAEALPLAAMVNGKGNRHLRGGASPSIVCALASR